MMREKPYPGVDMEAVRAHATKRANDSTLRALASEIGIGFTTLDNFLRGAEPRHRIRSDLCAWYMREQGDGRDAELAIEVLCRFVPDEQRRALRLALLDAIADAFRQGGRDVPGWIRRLREG